MISVAISLNDLLELDPCSRGVDRFMSLVPSPELFGHATVSIPEWTPLHGLWLAKTWPDDFRWLVERELVPRLSAVRANLAGIDLSDANLYGASFPLAHLDGANLFIADCRYADFAQASLRGADLRGTDLRNACLVGACLVGAQLDSDTLLEGAALESCEVDAEAMPHFEAFGWRRRAGFDVARRAAQGLQSGPAGRLYRPILAGPR